eukprot:SAG31_NODE_347_length_17310_cov_3.764743_8_plen_97_part_00
MVAPCSAARGAAASWTLINIMYGVPVPAPGMRMHAAMLRGDRAARCSSRVHESGVRIHVLTRCMQHAALRAVAGAAASSQKKMLTIPRATAMLPLL